LYENPTLPVTPRDPVILAEPVNGNATGAFKAFDAVRANDAVPNREPVADIQPVVFE
jgi:hypothetical protein